MDWALLRPLSEEDRQRVLSVARRRRFDRGEIICREGDLGDTLHLISRGRVAVQVVTRLGDTATLAVLGPQEAFGEIALVSDEARRTATVQALESTETFSIHKAHFEELRNARPSVERFLTEVLAAQVQRLTRQVLEALYLPVSTRLFRRLTELAHTYGGEDETVIPLTQDDIASMAGTSRPTANKIIREAEDDGLLRLGRRRIEVLDLQGLLREASYPPGEGPVPGTGHHLEL